MNFSRTPSEKKEGAGRGQEHSWQELNKGYSSCGFVVYFLENRLVYPLRSIFHSFVPGYYFARSESGYKCTLWHNYSQSFLPAIWLNGLKWVWIPGTRNVRADCKRACGERPLVPLWARWGGCGRAETRMQGEFVLYILLTASVCSLILIRLMDCVLNSLRDRCSIYLD